jgi:hypothetical protein
MVIPFTPQQERLPGVPEPFDPIPWEVREIDGAVATLMDEIISATTVRRCLELKQVAEDCALKLLAVESAALDRAGRLCGGGR